MIEDGGALRLRIASLEEGKDVRGTTEGGRQKSEIRDRWSGDRIRKSEVRDRRPDGRLKIED
jgi:hypothetical protein